MASDDPSPAAASSDPEALPAAAPASPPTEASGKRDVGRYRIGAVIAGDLHAAHDRLLDRDVQVRVADSALAGDLEREARFVARLAHPGITPVHDFVRGDGGALMVLDDVQGETLAEAIAGAQAGRVCRELASPGAVALLLRQVCDALAAAHARGVVHRALTPAGIVIGRHGQVVVGGWSTALASSKQSLTRRFAADAQAPDLPDLDDLHADVRAVGACLFEALVLRPPPAGDPCAGLAAAERPRLPAELGAIVRQALASGPAQGYRTMAALGEDLGRYLAGLPSQAYDPGAWGSCRGWVRRHRRGLRAAVLALALAGAGAWAGKVALDRWLDRWAPPLVNEEFADASWRERWLESSKGAFVTAKGRIVTQAPQGAQLIFRRRLVTPVAIEYTGQILPGAKPCDLSVIWCDRDGIPADPSRMMDDARVYMIQAGANDNTNCAIFQIPSYRRVAHANRQLEVGRDYRFRVEIDGERIAMAIDGEPVLEYRDVFPTASGYLMLYGYYPGKAFDDVQICEKVVPRPPSPVAAGDALYQFRHFADAASVYGRIAASYPGGEVGDQALFRKGLAERALKRNDLARETWTGLKDARLAGMADALRLEDLLVPWQIETIALRFENYYQERAAIRPELRLQWQQLIGLVQADPRYTEAELLRLIGLRDRLFPGDSASARAATGALLRLGRFQEILVGYPEERSACAFARLALGRTDELLEEPMSRAGARIARGEFDAFAQIPDVEATLKMQVMCKRGWAREALRDFGDAYPAQIYLGQADALLASLATRPHRLDIIAGECLLALGRFEEAAGPGAAGIAGSGGNPRAMLLLGRIDEAERAFRTADYWSQAMPVAWARLIRAVEAGDVVAAKALRPQVAVPPNCAWPGGWFASTVIGPFCDRLLGDREAPRAALARAVAEYPKVFGTRAWHVARHVLGQESDAELLAMPAASEGPAWLAVAKALRAELDDRPAEALAAWRAFAALPRHQRLLDGNVLDVQVELFAAWRLRALAGAG